MAKLLVRISFRTVKSLYSRPKQPSFLPRDDTASPRPPPSPTRSVRQSPGRPLGAPLPATLAHLGLGPGGQPEHREPAGLLRARRQRVLALEEVRDRLDYAAPALRVFRLLLLAGSASLDRRLVAQQLVQALGRGVAGRAPQQQPLHVVRALARLQPKIEGLGGRLFLVVLGSELTPGDLEPQLPDSAGDYRVAACAGTWELRDERERAEWRACERERERGWGMKVWWMRWWRWLGRGFSGWGRLVCGGRSWGGARSGSGYKAKFKVTAGLSSQVCG